MSPLAPAVLRPLPPEPARALPANDVFLRACRQEATPYTPVWFMRQAGRALPEYRAIRQKLSMFDVIRWPEVAAEVTRQPVDRYGVDAAVLFSDITTPLEAIGIDVRLVEGIGPVFNEPFSHEDQLAALRTPTKDDLVHVRETVELLVADLSVPVIGFAGAPFTVASYLVEGRPSKTHAATKSLMLSRPGLWSRLLDRLADIAIAFLEVQIDAGATAVQLFDSWAGALTPAQYADHVLPASRKIFDALAGRGVARVHFGVNTGSLLEHMAAAGADVVGVDWRVPLDEARRRLPSVGVQGNLDPSVCLAPWDVVEREAMEVIGENGGRDGHVFNLGHGVLPETDPAILRDLVQFVHESTLRP